MRHGFAHLKLDAVGVARRGCYSILVAQLLSALIPRCVALVVLCCGCALLCRAGLGRAHDLQDGCRGGAGSCGAAGECLGSCCGWQLHVFAVLSLDVIGSLTPHTLEGCRLFGAAERMHTSFALLLLCTMCRAPCVPR